jgi:hypothetical protein
MAATIQLPILPKTVIAEKATLLRRLNRLKGGEDDHAGKLGKGNTFLTMAAK